MAGVFYPAKNPTKRQIAMADEAKQPVEMTLKEFFENVPPGQTARVPNLAKRFRSDTPLCEIELPPIQLHCASKHCEGIRFFDPTDNSRNARPRARYNFFANYVCRNCKTFHKTYAFWAVVHEDETTGDVFKFGEVPPFGPPTPPRVITLIREERDYYLKGRRSENQGLGIAAFAYYRRVVENQKGRIFDEIIRVCDKLGAQDELIGELKAAKQETQFSKAMGVIKHAVPQALLIDGHNPLSLLHNALSEGLHAQTDEQCLELAQSIRVVLFDLVERMANALRDDAELKGAVSRLLRPASGSDKETPK